MEWSKTQYCYGRSDVDPNDQHKNERYGVEYLLSPSGSVIARIDKCDAPEDITFTRDLSPIISELNRLHEMLCAIYAKQRADLLTPEEISDFVRHDN